MCEAQKKTQLSSYYAPLKGLKCLFIKNFPLKNRSKITHSVCACNSILDCEGDTAWGDWICFSWIDARTSIIVSRIEDSICYRKKV